MSSIRSSKIYLDIKNTVRKYDEEAILLKVKTLVYHKEAKGSGYFRLDYNTNGSKYAKMSSSELNYEHSVLRAALYISKGLQKHTDLVSGLSHKGKEHFDELFDQYYTEYLKASKLYTHN